MSHGDTVGIIGAGPFGTALANLIANAGRSVILWSQDAGVVTEINKQHRNSRVPDLPLCPALTATDNPEQLVASARLLVLAVSSEDARGRARILGEFVGASHLFVHAIGALASPGDVRVSEVLLEETAALRIGVLAGPALWQDLAAGRFASMVVASSFDEVTREARRLLSVPPALRLYKGADLIGVELAAVLAGAYTVAVGISDALQLGPGTRAVLLTRAVAEASRLGEAAGARARTFTGLAGLGNLLVRTQTEHSRDYRLGQALARGQREETSSEGARAALAGVRLAARLGVRVPVLSAVAAVLAGKLSPREAAVAAADTVAVEE